jgi:hypothetical protein
MQNSTTVDTGETAKRRSLLRVIVFLQSQAKAHTQYVNPEEVRTKIS